MSPADDAPASSADEHLFIDKRAKERSERAAHHIGELLIGQPQRTWMLAISATVDRLGLRAQCAEVSAKREMKVPHVHGVCHANVLL